MSEFFLYQQFFSPEEAEGIISILNAHSIPYKFDKGHGTVDKTIGGEINDYYELKIPPDQFELVTSLMLANTHVNLDELDKDHYLFTFNNDELYSIIANPDEWSKQDYLIAVELLKQYGDSYTPEELQQLRKKKIEWLATPAKTTGGWIVLGYFFAFFGGLIAVVWGYTLWNFKKLLPDGRRVYIYQERDRRHGKRIFLLGVIMAIVGLFIRLYSDFLAN